jgi:hypothetical protein
MSAILTGWPFCNAKAERRGRFDETILRIKPNLVKFKFVVMTLHGFNISQNLRLLPIIIRLINMCCIWVDICPKLEVENLSEKISAKMLFL